MMDINPWEYSALSLAMFAGTISKVTTDENILFDLTDKGLLREVRGIQDAHGIRILYEITDAGRAALKQVRS